MKRNIITGKNKIKKKYDFSQSIKNPYVRKLKKQITIRIENETIEYFKRLAVETDISYQKLINMFLKECALNKKKPSITWNALGP